MENVSGDSVKQDGPADVPLKRNYSFTGTFTVCVKRNAHLISNFFVAPLGEGGQKFTWSIM